MTRLAVVPETTPEPRMPRLLGVRSAHRPYGLTFSGAVINPRAQPRSAIICWEIRDEWAGLSAGIYCRDGRSTWLVPGTQVDT